jgi:hypothetical protein
MPYAIRGNAVVKKKTGKVVGRSKSPKKYLRTLQAVEHGWKPSGKGHRKHSRSGGALFR